MYYKDAQFPKRAHYEGIRDVTLPTDGQAHDASDVGGMEIAMSLHLHILTSDLTWHLAAPIYFGSTARRHQSS